MDKIVKTDGVAQSLLHHERRIEKKIIRRRDVEAGCFFPEPGEQFFLYALTGDDERKVFQFIERDAGFPGQRIIVPGKDSPAVLVGDSDAVVLGKIGALHDDGHVEETLVDALRHGIRPTAVEMEMDIRVALLHSARRMHEKGQPGRFRAPDADVAAGDFIQRFEFRGRLVHHVEDVLRAFPEKLSFIRQMDAVAAPDEKRPAQFLLQFLQLPGQRRLRHVEKSRRLCDILFPHHFQKVS